MESARLLDRFLNECLSIPPAKENGEFNEAQYNATLNMPCMSDLRKNEECAKIIDLYEEGLITNTEFVRNTTLALYDGGL